MKQIFPVLLFIVLVCSYYIFLSNRTPANMDERASIVIALGRFPPLADKFLTAHSEKEYIQIVDYKKYSADSIQFRKVFESIVNDNGNAGVYYLALSGFIKLTGCNLVWLRLISILFAGVNLFLIFLLAGKFQSSIFFMWTTMIMTAFNPVFLLNAILVRAYMLALLGCLLSIHFLIKLISAPDPENRYYYFFFLSILLAAGNHYFTFSLLGAEFVFIFWKWGKNKFIRRKFFLGYFALLMLAGLWLYVSYPVSWENLQLLLHDNLVTANVDSGYRLSLKNLIRQWLNISTYFFSFSTDFMGKSRIFFKCLTGISFLFIMVGLIKMKKKQPVLLLVQLMVFSIIFYSLQSVIEGQLTNFIPKYLIFIIPVAILCINTALSELIGRYPGLTTKLFKNSLGDGN